MPDPTSPKHTPLPGSRFPQKDPELLRLEAYMVARINEERVLKGIAPVPNHPLLAACARAHSEEMRRLNYFAHESPTPNLHSASDRFKAAFGYQSRFIFENIYRGQCKTYLGPNDLLETTVRGWIKKPLRPERADIDKAHAALLEAAENGENILSPQATHVGVGLIFEKADIWITQMMAKI